MKIVVFPEVVVNFHRSHPSQRQFVISISAIERFLIECRKTKTNVITLANQNRRRQSNEPIRTRSKYM